MSMPMKFLSGYIAGQPDCIFTFAAAQLKDDRIIVTEPLAVPFSLQAVIMSEDIIK